MSIATPCGSQKFQTHKDVESHQLKSQWQTGGFPELCSSTFFLKGTHEICRILAASSLDRRANNS